MAGWRSLRCLGVRYWPGVRHVRYVGRLVWLVRWWLRVGGSPTVALVWQDWETLQAIWRGKG